MKDQSPIPIPINQRWQDFRTEILPVIIFAVVIAGVVWMWGRSVAPPTVIGEVQIVRTDMISILPGTIQELKTDLLQKVTNGQCLAMVRVMENDVLTNELAVIEAELRLLKTQMDVDKTRNLGSYAQMKRELLEEKLALALAKVREVQTDSELVRSKALFDAQLVTAGGSSSKSGGIGYEIALRDRDAAHAEADQHTRTIEQIEKDLANLEKTGLVTVNPADDVIEKNIDAKTRRFQALNRCVPLLAPMDGVVSVINHRVGEKIMAGTPVLVVSADHSDRVVAWVRQPISVTPKIGDTVNVCRTSPGQAPSNGTVSQVGSHLEPITATLLPPTSAQNRVVLGLPMTINLPPNSHFTPGEPVVIRFGAQRL